MYEYIKTIPEEMLDMLCFGEETNSVQYIPENHICNSIGCVLGHCIALDLWENIPYNSIDNTIDFKKWSFIFLEFHDNIMWHFLFSGNWKLIGNTKEQILKRLKYVIDHGNYPKLFNNDDWSPLNFNLILE